MGRSLHTCALLTITVFHESVIRQRIVQPPKIFICDTFLSTVQLSIVQLSTVFIGDSSPSKVPFTLVNNLLTSDWLSMEPWHRLHFLHIADSHSWLHASWLLVAELPLVIITWAALSHHYSSSHELPSVIIPDCKPRGSSVAELPLVIIT